MDHEFLQQQIVELRAEVAKLQADIEDLRKRAVKLTARGYDGDAQDVLVDWATR